MPRKGQERLSTGKVAFTHRQTFLPKKRFYRYIVIISYATSGSPSIAFLYHLFTLLASHVPRAEEQNSIIKIYEAVINSFGSTPIPVNEALLRPL